MIVTDEQGHKYEVDETLLVEIPRWSDKIAHAVSLGLLTAEQADVLEPAVEESEQEVQASEPENFPAAAPQAPACTVNRGGRHVFQRYGKDDADNVFGWCKCGYYGPAPCPHKEQRLNKRTKNVECAWCNKVIYGGTGTHFDDPVPREERDRLMFVDPNSFRGEV